MNKIIKLSVSDLNVVAGGGVFGGAGKIIAELNDWADRETRKIGEKIRESKKDFQEARDKKREELLENRKAEKAHVQNQEL